MTRGDDHVIITLDNWVKDIQGSSLLWTFTNMSFAGLAIHPTSTVHGVYMLNRNPGEAAKTTQYVGIDAPFAGLVRADWGVSAPVATAYPEVYIPVNAAEDASFGESLGLDPNEDDRFITPSLVLLAYLRAAPTQFQIKRMQAYYEVSPFPLPDDNGTPVPGYILRAVPAGGRKRATVVVQNTTPALTCTVWVSGIIADRTNALEAPLAAAVTGANGRTVFEIEDMNMSYLMVKGTAIDIDPGTGTGAELLVQIYLND